MFRDESIELHWLYHTLHIYSTLHWHKCIFPKVSILTCLVPRCTRMSRFIYICVGSLEVSALKEKNIVNDLAILHNKVSKYNNNIQSVLKMTPTENSRTE